MCPTAPLHLCSLTRVVTTASRHRSRPPSSACGPTGSCPVSLLPLPPLGKEPSLLSGGNLHLGWGNAKSQATPLIVSNSWDWAPGQGQGNLRMFPLLRILQRVRPMCGGSITVTNMPTAGTGAVPSRTCCAFFSNLL